MHSNTQHRYCVSSAPYVQRDANIVFLAIGVLAMAHELDRTVHVGEVRPGEPIRARLYVNIVRIACAYAKLPDLNSMQAPRFHRGYVSRLHKISEQMFIDMAIILRIIRQPPASNGKIYTLGIRLTD